MEDLEQTRTSPLAALDGAPQRMLGLTILWHPERDRIGAQYVGPLGAGTVALDRYQPVFHTLDAGDAVLGDLRVTRAPLHIARDRHDTITLTAPDSRMSILLDGAPLSGSIQLSTQQVTRGAVLELGGVVLLCIHWMLGLPQTAGGSALIGVSDGAIRLRDLVRQVASTDLPVLLLGETGTGKEVAARAIHATSARRDAPLVSVNMAALNESLAAADLFGAEKGAYTGLQAVRSGYFGEAGAGTLFLDEIGDTPATIQPMLLRVLETGQYRPLGARADLLSRARLVAATDRDLQARGFNQPLLRRLEAFVIHVPPLRARRPDIGLLVAAQLARVEAAGEALPELPVGVVSALCRNDWPGNIRQLNNVVQRLVLALAAGMPLRLEDVLDLDEAAPSCPTPDAAPRPRSQRLLSEVSDEEVIDALEASGWQVQAAARRLGISRPSLYRLLAAHPVIRQPQHIPVDELQRTLHACEADVARCASALRTPSEALRRHLRALGLLEVVRTA